MRTARCVSAGAGFSTLAELPDPLVCGCRTTFQGVAGRKLGGMVSGERNLWQSRLIGVGVCVGGEFCRTALHLWALHRLLRHQTMAESVWGIL